MQKMISREKSSFRTSSFRLALEAVFFMILGIIPRLILLMHNDAIIESDEAIVGLMGKHILEGSSVPVFYYGQAYMGSLEAIFAALSFSLFGINNLALKLVPFSFSILFIGMVYYCGYLCSGKITARIAALLIAIPPAPLVIWSLKARGGFIETLVIGSAALLLTLVLLRRKEINYKKDRSLWIGISLLLGLGWWTNNQIIFYIAPLGSVLLFRLFSYKGILDKSKVILSSILFFIIGGLPFWIENIVNKPRWSSFEVLFGSTAGNNTAQYFSDYWSTALPIILGARQFWSDADTVEGATTFVYLFYSLPLLISALIILTNSKKRILSRENLPVLCLSLFLFFVPLIFSMSSFGWLSKAPRYLLPLYSVISILIGLALSRLIVHRSKLVTCFAWGVMSGILIINLCSNYLGGITDEGQPIVFRNERVDKDHAELYAWLDKEGYTHIYTNYWIGYRVAFETNERITFTRFGNPRSLRIPEYETENPPYEILGKAFVLTPREAYIFEEWLKAMGMTMRKTHIRSYVIIDQIQYEHPEGKAIALSADQITFFIPPWGEEAPEIAKNVNALIDDSADTRWGSGKPQAPGMAIEIAFESPQDIHRMVLDHRGFPHDIPNSLKITAYLSEGDETITLFDMTQVKFFNEIRASHYVSIPPLWDIRFEKAKVRKIRLELMQGIPVFDWSINDLKVYQTEK